MKNSLLVLLLSIGFTVNIFSQSEDIDKLNYVTLDILSPITSYAPRYEIGYYRHLDDRWIVGAEVGSGTYATTIYFAEDGNWIEKDYQSFSIAPEIKYVLNPSRKTRKFVSAELFYIYHADKLLNRSYTNTSFTKSSSYDQADYQRNKFGLNFNYGMIINFSNSVGLIPKIGAGVKIRDVQFSNIDNLIVNDVGDYEDCSPDFVSRHLEVEGLITRFNFNFELQFFYKF